MDQSSFDRIVKTFGAVTSRRTGILTLLAAAAGVAAVEEGQAKGAKREKARKEGPCGDGSRKANMCTQDSDCCTNVCNMAVSETNKDGMGRCRCVRKEGACESDTQCCGGRPCVEGICGGTVCSAWGGPCSAVGDCCSSFATACSGGKCCADNNAGPCSSNAECCSNFCNGGICAI
ncbi:MAG: hypothetical protein ACR2J8_05665 [Thermomicrobiales bacterium]